MTTTAIKSTTAELPQVFEVFFYENKEGGSITERLFSKGNSDYHKMYLFTGTVVHLSVRFGAWVYEVTEEGTVKYPWTEALLEDPRMVGFYTLSLKNYSTDTLLATMFTLENFLGKKLDIRNCLQYLWQSIGIGKPKRQIERMGTNATQDLMNLEPGTYKKIGRKEYFNLPYTCATLVNAVLHRLFEYEPGFTGHLAQSATMTLTIFADCGWGSVYDLDTGDYIVDNG